MINTTNPLDEALIEKIRNLEQQIAQKDREEYIILNNLQRKNRELKNQFQQTQRQNMDTKKEVLQLQSKNDHFKIQVENYSNEIHDLKQKLQQLLNEQEFLSQEIKYLKSELKQDQLIEQEILKKNEQFKRLHNTINELEKQLRLLQLNQYNYQIKQITIIKFIIITVLKLLLFLWNLFNFKIYKKNKIKIQIKENLTVYQTQQINHTIQPCQIHQQNEEITIPVYVPIIEQTKYIEQPIKQYQVERIVETSNSNIVKPQSVCYQPVHYTTQQHWVSMQPFHNHHNHHHHHSCQSNYGYKYSYF